MHPEPEPKPITGNTAACYICGRDFSLLAKFVQKCCIKLDHGHYFMSVCIWCHSSYLSGRR